MLVLQLNQKRRKKSLGQHEAIERVLSVGLGAPEGVLVLDDQRAAVANLKQRGDEAGPVDDAETGNAEAVGALADASALRAD